MKWPEMEVLDDDGVWYLVEPVMWEMMQRQAGQWWATPKGRQVMRELLDGRELNGVRVKR